MAPILYIVIPCYNEQSVLPLTAPLFRVKLSELIDLGKIHADSRVLFVNDGSSDKTWNIISELAQADPVFMGISLSRNHGHQNALLAGLMEAKESCDITISIDCDGQDDIDTISSMIDAYLEGNEIVYGVRSSRKTDTLFKRLSAETFYKILNLMGAKVIFNHADYRLISSRALHEFQNFKEVNLYLRGLVPLLGFKSTTVFYERKPRLAGGGIIPCTRWLDLRLTASHL